MLDQLIDPHNLPFAVSLALMLLLALVQIAGVAHLLGDHGDADVDGGDLDVDAGLLSLMGIGRLPFLMWLMLFLTVFGLVGLSGQQLIASFIGGTLNPWLAAPLAALAAFPLTGLITRPLAAIMPRDETTAVSDRHPRRPRRRDSGRRRRIRQSGPSESARYPRIEPSRHGRARQ